MFIFRFRQSMRPGLYSTCFSVGLFKAKNKNRKSLRLAIASLSRCLQLSCHLHGSCLCTVGRPDKNRDHHRSSHCPCWAHLRVAAGCPRRSAAKAHSSPKRTLYRGCVVRIRLSAFLSFGYAQEPKMSASLLLPHMRQVALVPRAFTCHTLAQLAGGSQAWSLSAIRSFPCLSAGKLSHCSQCPAVLAAGAFSFMYSTEIPTGDTKA